MARSKIPATIAVEVNSLYPRWICYVYDAELGSRSFFRGFKSHDEMFAWIRKVGYVANETAALVSPMAATSMVWN